MSTKNTCLAQGGFTPAELAEKIHGLCIQSVAVHQAAENLSCCKNSLRNTQTFNQLSSLLWVLGDLLEKQEAFADELVVGEVIWK